MPCIWNDWLPPSLAEEIKLEEPKRFCKIIDTVCNDWYAMDEDASMCDKINTSLRYVPLVKGMLNAKVEPGIQKMQRLTETLLDIVLHTEADLTAQARWGGILHRIIRSHGKKMELSIDWKPLYMMLRRHHLVTSANFEGAGVMEARRQALVHLLHQARRFFPPNTAGEIWEHFKPTLQDPHSSEAFESVGWICMMLPTQEALKGQGSWSEWMDEWMHIWGQRVHNQTWQSLWFSLMARLAKHDVHGVIDWHGITSLMVNRFLWAFHVPLGPASASPPFSAGAPASLESLFGNDIQSRSASMAKALIYSIGRENICENDGDEQGEDPGLACLETIVAVFEQYYHPSNGGKWSSGLAMFLREIAFHLCNRLVAEHAYLVSPSDSGMISGGESEEEPSEDEDDEEEDDASMGTAEVCVDSSVTDEDIATGGVRGGEEIESKITLENSRCPRRHLTPEVRRKIVALIMRLALKGQSGKDSTMRRNASQVLSLLANIEPHIVLPEVERHFVTALETITAARQYGNAIQTLSLCIRPMLIAGIPSDINEGMDDDLISRRNNAIRCIQAAMNATLPGIDANDPPKSLAVFRLYCSVLSCVGQLSENGMCLYSEEWANDLLGRIFAVITNVDSPDGGEHTSHAGNKFDDNSSFLLDGNSMFRPLMELLYARLPPDLRMRAIRQTSEFLLGNTLASVAPEAAILCNAMAWADPEQTKKFMLDPLINKLIEECDALEPHAGKAVDTLNSTQLSKVQEATLSWRLGLLSSLVYHMGVQSSFYGKQIKGIFGVLLRSSSVTVQSAAARCLSSMLVGLSSYYPLRQYSACLSDIERDEIQLENFVDKFGQWDLPEYDNSVTVKGESDCVASFLPTWHDPCAQEIALANELLVEFLEVPSIKILGAAKASEAITKAEMRSMLMTMEGAIEGARSCLPDFASQNMPSNDDAASIIGKLGATIGTPDLRAKVAEALVAASDMIHINDVETLTVYLRILDSTLAVGSAEYHSSDSCASAWISDDKWLQQPAVSGFLQADGDANLAWRRRRPRWVAIEKVFMNLEWRASQSAYRKYASIKEPWVSIDKIPNVYLDAVGLAIHYMLKGGSNLRDLAVSLVERCAKRYPLLVKYICAPICAGLAKLPDKIKFDTSVSCVDLIPALLESAKTSGQRAAEAAASGIPESEEEQSLGVGAGSMLRWIAAWRYFTRDYEGLRALMLSLISSFTYSGPEAQISMTMSQVMFALRSMRPNGPNASFVADQICMDCISIIEDARKGASSSLSGRHETITILFPLYILPDITPKVASKLMLMYVKEAVSDTPLAQKVSTVAIIYMLLPLWKPFYDEGYSDETPKMSDESIAAAKDSLSLVLEAEGHVLLPRVLQTYATAHHNMASSGEDGQSRRSRSLGNREETVVAAALSTLVKGLEWPSSAGGFKAIVQGNFTVRHARFVQVLTMANPAAVMQHLKSPLQSIVSQPQDVDKPSVAAAAEIMAGLIASKAVFSVSDEESQWNLWFADTLRQALESAPLDFLNIWGDCVLRFGLNGLKEQTKDDIPEIQSIVEVALSKKPLEQAGSSSAELYKKVIYLTEVLQEMVGDATGTFPCAPKLGIYERKIIMDCLHSVPALIESSCDTDLSRQAIAGLMADASMIVLTISCSDPPGAITMRELRDQIDIMLDKIYAKFDEATAFLFEKNKDKVASHSTGEAVMDVDGEQQGGKISDDREEDNALSYVAFVCELTYQFLAGASSHASPLVIRPLRNIMRVLELIPSEAQFVGSAVRLALRSSKYQPLEPEFIDQALQTLIESLRGELWTERAAALQFMQYFWFRNVIVLGQQGSERVLNEALRLLEDPKLEVREMACDTISGVIRALSSEKQAEIREKIVSRSKEIFPDRKRRRMASNGSISKFDAQISLPERHGAVLALRALVISSPYDVPQWLPEILMALVRLASEPAPVKNTVREALSDFRRTHEEGGLLEVKDAMTAEQWEAVRDVAVGAASYFV